MIVALTAPSAMAASFTQVVDFNFKDPARQMPVGGEVIDVDPDLFIGLGFTLSVAPNNSGSTLGLFNSNCGPDFPGVACGGNDGDLATGPTFGTDPQGLVLVINESTTDVNDDPDGGVITFSFANPVDISSVTLLDLDDNADDVGKIDFGFEFADTNLARRDVLVSDLLNSNTKVLGGALGSENSLVEFTFVDESGTVDGAFQGVSEFSIEYNGVSGAVAGLTYERFDVPVPAALPLMLTGLGLLGYLRARRRG
ncbi:MAG: hypothetical protein ACFBRM_09935 [Pikeienuella sp.]